MHVFRAQSIGLAWLALALSGCGTGGSTPTSSTPLEPLQLQLSASKGKIAFGEAITFTTFISNPNSVPVNLYLGRSYSGVCFANGSAIEARKAETTGWDSKDVLKHQWKTGFCGTCSYSLVVAVPAKGNISYTAAAVVKVDDKGQPYLNFGGSKEHDFLTLPLSGNGKFLVHAAHTVSPESEFNTDSEDKRWLPKEHSVENGYAPNPKAPFWRGTMMSNDVPLEINVSRRD